MFVGHYGVSFAAKKAEPSIPLWVLFIAVQLLDVLWAPFVLLGIEMVRIVPGITASNPLDSTTCRTRTASSPRSAGRLPRFWRIDWWSQLLPGARHPSWAWPSSRTGCSTFWCIGPISRVAIDAAICKVLAKNREDRFDSAGGFAAALLA